MNHKSINLKKFIAEFNFPNPDWNNLPYDFPNLSKTGLTREEGYLLDGIKLAWMASESQGKMHLLKNSLKISLSAIALLAILSISRNFVKSPEWQYARQVSAATISATLKTTGISSNANELNIFLESTMSGVLKRK